MMATMCRSIRVLHNFEPPTTVEEMRAAALQYIRKVSGLTRPTQADQAAFDQAIDEVTATTERLLRSLTTRGNVRTRENERLKAQERWKKRAGTAY
jgi:hypothetical protein